MSEPITTSAIATHWTLAVFWAFVHALNAHRTWKSKTFIDFLSLTIMSSFTWVMFTLLGLHLFPSAPYIVYAMSWTGWYLWIEWMSILVGYLKTRFTK